MPKLQREQKIPEITSPIGEKRRRVGVLIGCVQQVFFSQVNAATVRVLAAEGCEVVAPKNQGCCGALSTHAGREEESLDFARKTIDTFEREDLDNVVINAAGLRLDDEGVRSPPARRPRVRRTRQARSPRA